MGRFYGGQFDLNDLIEKHLFIISPNNSGSTFLRELLATSKATWNLEREGQHSPGFKGPSTRSLGNGLIWGSNESTLHRLTDKRQYNWKITRKAWYFRSYSQSKTANIFATSSPPFLLNVDMLEHNFHNPRFLFMVRNPYAVIEGICRREARLQIPDGQDIRQLAARHIAVCMRYQRDNVERFSEQSIFFTYEEMCGSAEIVMEKIEQLLPEIHDLNISRKISVKWMYNEPIRDMNAQQIARLSPDDISVISDVLRTYSDVMDYFGYEILR